MDPENIKLFYVKRVANIFLREYHPSLKLPVPIEEIAELKLKIKIILIPRLIKNFGVNAFLNHTFDTIVIDEFMYIKQPDRIRFTLAEEVGHLILHKEWYSKHGPSSLENYYKWVENLDAKTYAYVERQAKTFASFILMPEEKVMEVMSQFAKQYGLKLPCSVLDLPDSWPDLAKAFEVSVHSFLIRLSQLELVNVPDRVWKKVSRGL